ncbi:hypothetical protein BJX66DRAFT_311461 [Aspergillus keveii]|uniref:F-box domain-containing protein n=1 Tax=Aspergillus keveii TaxID=714993 RepID=A0ABR4FVC9_9EURO
MSSNWDLDLCLDIAGIPVIPFRFFVSPKPSHARSDPVSFPRFCHLPLEIQTEIVSLCDLPTLFQLIHTSSHIRAVSLKPFQKCLKELWYYNEVTHTGHYYAAELIGRVLHCPEFARHITQIEISFRLSSWNLLAISLLGKVSDKARKYWKKIQDLYPSVTKVVFSGMMENILSGGDPPSAANRAPHSCYDLLEIVVREAPAHITPLIALADRSGNPYQLWQCTNSPESSAKVTWVLLQPSWAPKRTIIPARKLSPGLIQDVVRRDRKHWFWNLELKGLMHLAVQSYRRYAPEASLECAHPGCDAKFTSWGSWDDHIKEKCTKSFKRRGMRPSRHVPEDVGVVFQQRRARVEQLHAGMVLLKDKFLDTCGPSHSEKRMQFEALLPVLLEEQGLLLPERGDSLDVLDSLEFIHGMYTGKYPGDSQEN